jgi:hypothetical protein
MRRDCRDGVAAGCVARRLRRVGHAGAAGVTVTEAAKSLLLVATFGLYVAKQTLLLQHFGPELDALILAVMMLSLLALTVCHPRELGVLSRRALPWIVMLSSVVYYALFADARATLALVAKLLFLLACGALLESEAGRRTLRLAADAIVVAVVVIAVLALVGAIPSNSGFSAAGDKFSLGMFNPNAPMFFVFSALAVYFVIGARYRLLLGIGCILGLYLFGALSRTYFAASVLLIVLGLGANTPSWRRVAAAGLFTGAMIAWCLGLAVVFVAILFPEVLAPYTETPLDVVLSHRLSVLIAARPVAGDTLTGIHFEAQDSMFHELLFVFGPATTAVLMIGLLRAWVRARRSAFEYRHLVLITIVVAIGLFEGVLLKVTPLSILALRLLGGPAVSEPPPRRGGRGMSRGHDA